MRFVNQLGSLYSQKGLRFGGFKTSEFIDLTENIENKQPNSRESIIAEAHYQVFWSMYFADIVFLVSLLLYKSLLLSILFFIAAYILEKIRLYIFGPSEFFSNISYLWSKIKFIVYILTIIFLWQVSSFLSVSVLVFSIVEGYLSLIGAIVMLPVSYLLSICFSRTQNIEGYIMHWTILKWQEKLGFTKSTKSN